MRIGRVHRAAAMLALRPYLMNVLDACSPHHSIGLIEWFLNEIFQGRRTVMRGNGQRLTVIRQLSISWLGNC